MGCVYRLLAVLYAVLIGGCLGSFLNVAVWRLPAGKSLIRPASFCPKCGHPIRFYDNIPVFGWLFLRGKCRDCRQPISPRYPIVEGIVAAAGGILAALFFIGRRGVPAGIFRWDGLSERLAFLADYQSGETFFSPVTPEGTLLVGLGMTLLWLAVCAFVFGLALIHFDGHRLSPLWQGGLLCGAILLLGEAGIVPAAGTVLYALAAPLFGRRAIRARGLAFSVLFFVTLTGIIFFYGISTEAL